MSMYDDETAPPPHARYYDEEPPPPRRRRSPLIAVLAVVAGILAILVGIGIVLFALGIIGGPQQQQATSEPARVTDTTRVPAQETVAAPPATTPAPATQSAVPQAAVSLAPPTQDLPPVRSVHGDWQLRCDRPAGALNEQCFLMQFVTAEDRENVGLMVVVLKTADGQARIMRIVAPLGVLLPAGLGLQIDQEDLGRAGFVRCTPRGCVAEVILEDALLQKLQTGATATFIIFQTPEEGVGIPIALAGFPAGYGSLP